MGSFNAKILLFLAVTWFVSTAQAQNGPSVWESLQNSSGERIRARIESVQIGDSTAQLTVNEMGRSQSRTLDLCRSTNVVHADSWALAVNINALSTIQTAVQTGAPVELQVRGPWNSCIESVSIQK